MSVGVLAPEEKPLDLSSHSNREGLEISERASLQQYSSQQPMALGSPKKELVLSHLTSVDSPENSKRRRTCKTILVVSVLTVFLAGILTAVVLGRVNHTVRPMDKKFKLGVTVKKLKDLLPNTAEDLIGGTVDNMIDTLTTQPGEFQTNSTIIRPQSLLPTELITPEDFTEPRTPFHSDDESAQSFFEIGVADSVTSFDTASEVMLRAEISDHDDSEILLTASSDPHLSHEDKEAAWRARKAAQARDAAEAAEKRRQERLKLWEWAFDEQEAWDKLETQRSERERREAEEKKVRERKERERAKRQVLRKAQEAKEKKERAVREAQEVLKEAERRRKIKLQEAKEEAKRLENQRLKDLIEAKAKRDAEEKAEKVERERLIEIARLATIAEKKADQAAEILRQEQLERAKQAKLAALEAAKKRAAADKLERERLAAEKALQEAERKANEKEAARQKKILQEKERERLAAIETTRLEQVAEKAKADEKKRKEEAARVERERLAAEAKKEEDRKKELAKIAKEKIEAEKEERDRVAELEKQRQANDKLQKEKDEKERLKRLEQEKIAADIYEKLRVQVLESERQEKARKEKEKKALLVKQKEDHVKKEEEARLKKLQEKEAADSFNESDEEVAQEEAADRLADEEEEEQEARSKQKAEKEKEEEEEAERKKRLIQIKEQKEEDNRQQVYEALADQKAKEKRIKDAAAKAAKELKELEKNAPVKLNPREELRRARTQKIRQIVIDCREVFTKGVAFAKKVSKDLMAESKLQEVLLDELSNLQKHFQLFPNKANADEEWAQWLASPNNPIDQQSRQRIGKAIRETFSNEKGEWLTPDELRIRFSKIFKIRVEAGFESTEVSSKNVLAKLPPIPNVKNVNACSEVGIAVLEEIRDDLKDLLKKVNLNKYLEKVKEYLDKKVKEREEKNLAYRQRVANERAAEAKRIQDALKARQAKLKRQEQQVTEVNEKLRLRKERKRLEQISLARAIAERKEAELQALLEKKRAEKERKNLKRKALAEKKKQNKLAREAAAKAAAMEKERKRVEAEKKQLEAAKKEKEAEWRRQQLEKERLELQSKEREAKEMAEKLRKELEKRRRQAKERKARKVREKAARKKKEAVRKAKAAKAEKKRKAAKAKADAKGEKERREMQRLAKELEKKSEVEEKKASKREKKRKARTEKIRQVIIDCQEVFTKGVQFAKHVTLKLAETSKIQEVLLEELSRLQRYFSFFPKDPKNNKEWREFVQKPQIPIDPKSADRLTKAIKETFSDNDGQWLSPNELGAKLRKVFILRLKVGAETMEDAKREALKNLPPLPTVKNLNACSEVGLAVLDEIRGDVKKYLKKIKFTQYLKRVKKWAREQIKLQRAKLQQRAADKKRKEEMRLRSAAEKKEFEKQQKKLAEQKRLEKERLAKEASIKKLAEIQRLAKETKNTHIKIQQAEEERKIQEAKYLADEKTRKEKEAQEEAAREAERLVEQEEQRRVVQEEMLKEEKRLAEIVAKARKAQEALKREQEERLRKAILEAERKETERLEKLQRQNEQREGKAREFRLRKRKIRDEKDRLEKEEQDNLELIAKARADREAQADADALKEEQTERQRRRQARVKKIRQIIISCKEVFTTGVNFAKKVSEKLVNTSKLKEVLLVELSGLQEHFKFFPKDTENSKEWNDYLCQARSKQFDPKSISRVSKAVRNEFQDKKGKWLSPSELGDRLEKIFKIRQRVKMEDPRENYNQMVSDLPPVPAIKNMNACSEVGLAVIDEIRGDIRAFLKALNFNSYLKRVRVWVRNYVARRRQRLQKERLARQNILPELNVKPVTSVQHKCRPGQKCFDLQAAIQRESQAMVYRKLAVQKTPEWMSVVTTVGLECQEVLTTGAAYSEAMSQKLLSSSLRTDRIIDELVAKQSQDLWEQLKPSFNVERKLDSIELRKRLLFVHETRRKAGLENTKQKMATLPPVPKLKKDQQCDEVAESVLNETWNNIERFVSAASFNDFLDRVNRSVQG